MNEKPASEMKDVLVVEDEDVLRDLLSQLLQDNGYTVHAVADAAQAIALAKSYQVGVAIIDKNLPGGLDGLDVLRELRQLCDITRAIMLTGYPSRESAITALQLGAFDYLEKPVDNRLLLEKVRRAWDGYALALDHNEVFRKYETLFEIVPGIVWFMTEDGVLTRFNQEGAAMLEYGPKDLMGQDYSILLPHDERRPEAHWAFKERRTGDRATRRQTVELVTRSGRRRIFQISATGAYDRSASEPNKRRWGTLGVGWDITEHTLREAELQEARKLEAIGRLAGGIAHDFNNLLTVILSNAQFLQQQVDPEHAMQTDLRDIELAATQAADLTRQLLTFSRKQVISPKPHHLGEIVIKLRSMLRRLISESIEIDVACDPDLRRVLVDGGQMEQLIINLAANARDAMPNGGKLFLQTSNVVLDAEYAESHANVVPGPYVMLAVSDTGVGMSPEVRRRVFEPFYTTKAPGKGTGLGLATVHGIVAQNRGVISLYSEENVGTTFKVYFPALESTADEPAAVATSTCNLQRGHERVLLVEDEDLVRELATRILRRQGYEVIAEANAEEALRHCPNEDVPFQLLVTDVVMPGMGGPKLARLLRRRAAALRVLYTSGYVGNIVRRQDLLTDGATFLQKPFTATSLLTSVRELLDQP